MRKLDFTFEKPRVQFCLMPWLHFVAFPPVPNFIFILAVTMVQDVKCLVKFKYMEKLCDSRGNL